MFRTSIEYIHLKPCMEQLALNYFSFTTVVAHVGSNAITDFCFNDIYPCCINEEGNFVKLVLFFFILHTINSKNSLFSKAYDVLLLIFRIEYVKYLCHALSEIPRLIFKTYLIEVNYCEPEIMHFNTFWVLDPFDLKYWDL